MKFNYETEKRRFEKKWKQLRKEYADAGMDEQAIQKMYEYDWEDFKKERVHCIHNQNMPEQVIDYEPGMVESNNPLLAKFFQSFSVQDTYCDSSRYGWIEDIDNEKLAAYLRSIPQERLEIITQYVFDEKTQEEIASEFGISRSSLADRISRIKKNLKKFI